MFRKRETDGRPEVQPSSRNKPTIWLYLGLAGCVVYLALSLLLSFYLVRFLDVL